MKRIEKREMRKYHRKLSGMACSFCVETIRKALTRLEGVEEAHVSLSHEEVLVLYDPTKIHEKKIEHTLINLGYRVRSPRKLETGRDEELEKLRKYLLVAGILVLTSLILMLAMWIGIKNTLFKWIMLIVALATMFGPGWHIKRMAWHSLKAHILNQHVLLEMGAFSGLIGGILGILIYPSFPSADFLAVSTFLTGYHILGEWASLYVKRRASKAVEKLLELQPNEAVVIEDGIEKIKNIEELRIGDIVRVRPGERIPIDGVVIRGYTAVDESLVTGESIPIEKTVGDEVIGGSINIAGSIDIKVSRIGEDTFIKRVAKMVEEARALKPSILLIVDKILKYYVPTVLTIALGAFLFWTLGMYTLTLEMDATRAIYATLTVFVMGYPCALGMAMPLALMHGGGEAAERGILMRSGEAFQTLPNIEKILLDKTGTLTRGEIEINEIICFQERDLVMRLAGSAELLSEHPVAKALIKHLDKQNITYIIPEKFHAYPGKGIEAWIEGRQVIVGKPSLLTEKNIEIDRDTQRMIKELESEAKGVSCISIDGRLAGLIIFNDPIKQDAQETIHELKKRGIEPIMLTGDNSRVAKAVAEQLNIEKYYAEIHPEEKMEIISRLQEEGYKVAMVGDGINDAPSLMHADVGIAMGTGTDIAIESADIIIVSNDARKIVDAIDIAKKSYRKTKENLLLAFLFNGIGIPIAATGILHPSIAMIAMALSVTTIILNSLRPKRKTESTIERHRKICR